MDRELNSTPLGRFRILNKSSVRAIIGVLISHICSHLTFNKTFKPNSIVSTCNSYIGSNSIVSTCNNYIDFNLLNLTPLFNLVITILISWSTDSSNGPQNITADSMGVSSLKGLQAVEELL